MAISIDYIGLIGLLAVADDAHKTEVVKAESDAQARNTRR